MKNFLASLGLILYNLTNSHLLTFLIFTAFIFIATIGLNTTIYKNILKSPMIKMDIEAKVGKKIGKDKKVLKDSDIYLQYQFLPFMPSIAKLLYVVCGLFISFTYTSDFMLELKPSLFNMAPLYQNVLSTAKESGVGAATKVIVCCFSAMALQFVYDSIVATQMCYDQRQFDRLAFFAAFAACLWLPFAFTIYWFILHLALIAFVYYSLTFGKPKLDEKVEKECPPDHPVIVYENEVATEKVDPRDFK